MLSNSLSVVSPLNLSSPRAISAVLGPAVALLLLSACGQSETPHLSMCQSVTKNLVGAVEWGDSSVNESTNLLTVKANYQSGGQSGSVTCDYRRERTDDGNGQFATAPESVKLNGQRVATRDLLKAGTQASKEQLGAVAKETAKQTEIVAKDTAQKAGQLAEQAGEQAGVLAEQASEKAGELAGQAGELGEQARDLAVEATKKVQQALENQ